MNENTNITNLQELDPFTPKEREIVDLLNEINRQAYLQEAATQLFNAIYHLACSGNGNQIELMKDTIYAMFVRAENCRTEILNISHEIRDHVVVSEQAREMYNKHPYKRIEPIIEWE